ncbi:ABC transporter permease [uncultured Ruminococcus sp.]|uniref:ABC transporter permease n=1 Tax=uncultured Ruminococcus sp. TaxID=165186 RepID=UPI0025D02CC0|nr:ABC transporter permease [uncultured Ruminococcus sp.]
MVIGQLLLYDDSRGDLVIYPDTSMAVMNVDFIVPVGNLDKSTGMFTLSPEYEKAMTRPYNTLAGRGFTAEDVVYGRRVARLTEDLFRRYTGSEKPYSEYETPPTIELFGESFEIIGISGDAYFPILIPITSIPEDAVIDAYTSGFFELIYDLPVTHNQYSLVKETVESAYPGILTVLELEFAQTDAVYYNTIIGISVFVAAIAALNFAILYQFVVMNRRKMIAVFGCCGCTRGRIARMFLGELLLLTLPLLAAGMLCYQYLLLPLLTERFVYIAGAFSLKLYVLIFVIFAAVTLLLVRIMLHRYISRLPVDCLKGGENV